MRGFTLIEILVGLLLFAIVFGGILAGFFVGFRVLKMGERKITATQIAQGEIEKIRNMSYLNVGIIGLGPEDLPKASGLLPASSTVTLNNITYTIERNVEFVVDPSDEDTNCQWDYKNVLIKVSFSSPLRGEVVLSTNVIPKNKVEEIQACLLQPGGVLSVQVINALGEFIPSPTIEIFDPVTNELMAYKIADDGKWDFPLSAGEYKVRVSKTGYSSVVTYGITEIAIPEKPNPIVLNGEITQISLIIDKISSLKIKTLSTYGQNFFSDTFNNEEKISQKENIFLSSGMITLATDSEGYLPSGYLYSIAISPVNLLEWENLSFSHEKPTETNIKYQIFFASGSEWSLIPENVLPGNAEGFENGPINLSRLSTSTYYSLMLKANLETNSSQKTPSLDSWQISWKTSSPLPMNEVSFDLRGEKIIGKNAEEIPVYKFSTTTQTNAVGEKEINELEWDNYYLSNFKKGQLVFGLVNIEPEHPINLEPDENLEVNVYLETENSLLLTLQDEETLEPIFSATATLSNHNFSQTQQTNAYGQTIFFLPSVGNYQLSVEALDYYSTSTSLYISGRDTFLLKMEAINY